MWKFSDLNSLVELFQKLEDPLMRESRRRHPQFEIYIDPEGTYDEHLLKTREGKIVGPARFLHLSVKNKWVRDVDAEVWIESVEVLLPDRTFEIETDFNKARKLKWANEPIETGFGRLLIEPQGSTRMDLCYAIEGQGHFHLYTPHEDDGVKIKYHAGVYRLTVRVKPDSWENKNIYRAYVFFGGDWQSLVFPSVAPQDLKLRKSFSDLNATVAWE